MYLSVLAVHKQRDVVPLSIHSDAGESDDGNEEPVFDFQVPEPLYFFKFVQDDTGGTRGWFKREIYNS